MINDDELRQIAEKYSTPSFVFDGEEASKRAEDIKKILKSSGKKVRLCYSIKANPFLIPLLTDSVDMFEVCSPGELEICKHYKVPGEMIIYSGVHKELKDISEAIKYGVKIITVESVRHYELINAALQRFAAKVDIILRLSAKSQFGMSPEDIDLVIRKNRSDKNINILGIHYFVGTQRTKLKHQKEEIAMLAAYIKEVRSSSALPLPLLEYGPGLPFPYFEGDDHSDTLAPLKELNPHLDMLSDISELTVEMGRFLSSSCGYYLTKVVDKKSSFGRNWCIVDGGIHHANYYGQMLGMKIPKMRILPYNGKIEKNTEKWAVCGSLCTTNDVLVRECDMQEPMLNDLLVLCNIGAYSVTEGINLFLSRSMPRVLIKDHDQIRLVRNFVETWRVNS
ncbi:MAG: alanine racemase [Lachnospiraceae bacterium]|nr:alanine racemase [Lachnospiraceae bacterium]